MDRFGAGFPRGLEHALLVEVALGRSAGAEQVRLVGEGDVERAAVRLRVDGDGADTELAQRAEDADGDLAAVGNQHFPEGRHVRRILPP